MDDEHIPSTLRSPTETDDQTSKTEITNLEERDTDPCEPPDEEDSPESDGRPIEYPHLHRQVDD